MIKKILFLIILSILFSACTKTKQEIITFSSWGSVTETKILNDIINQYELENPNVKINFIHIPQNYFQKLHLLIASSQTPDVMFLNNLYLPFYQKELDNLSQYIDKNKYNSKSIEIFSENQILYAVPRDISTLVFYRNKNIIKKTPKNLKELKSLLEGIKPYGISYERNLYFMLPYIITFDEDIFHPQKSLEFYKSLEGNYAPTPSQIGSVTLAQMFLDKKIGLYLSGRWLYPKIKEKADFDWDIIPFCGKVPMDASGWGVAKNSKHKKEAIKCVQYLSSKEVIDKFTQTGLIIPARLDSFENVENKEAFIEAINHSVILETDRNFKKRMDLFNKNNF